MLVSGMTSVTFRKHSIAEVVALCKAARLNGIEWGGDVHVPSENPAAADEAKKRCFDEGLKIYSYGSYYSPTKFEDFEGAFERTAETCRRLGCATVRIWAGEKWRHEATNAEYIEFIERMQRVGEIAEKYALTVCFEHHQNTLSDGAAHTDRLLRDIGIEHVKTYWQPICPRVEDNLKCLELLRQRIVNVHVYHWTGWDRHLLQTGRDDWRRYVSMLAGESREIPCLLEFALGDEERNFFADAACLRELLGE